MNKLLEPLFIFSVVFELRINTAGRKQFFRRAADFSSLTFVFIVEVQVIIVTVVL